MILRLSLPGKPFFFQEFAEPFHKIRFDPEHIQGFNSSMNSGCMGAPEWPLRFRLHS